MNGRVLMLGTGFDTKGGVASVVNAYREAGLFVRCQVHYVPTHGDGTPLRKLLLGVDASFGVVLALFRYRITLVHVHVSSRASFWRKLLLSIPCLLLRKPLLLHLHGGEFHVFHDKEAGALTRRAIHWLFGRAERTLVLSESWAAWMRAAIPEARVGVLHNPVNMPPATPFEARDPCTILFLGRLGHSKGAYDLLEALRQVVPAFPDVRLLLGGDGELDEVRSRATALGLDKHVELLGWVTGEKKRELLARCTIFTLPSYNEGQPMSVLEAMAAGAPVVSTHVGGVPDALRDRVEGLLIAPGDVPALSAALFELLSNHTLRGQMGDMARRRVHSTFSTEVLLPRLEGIYSELTAARRG